MNQHSAATSEGVAAVGSRVRILVGPLKGVIGSLIALRGSRVLVAPDIGSPRVMIEIDRDVVEFSELNPQARSSKAGRRRVAK